MEEEDVQQHPADYDPQSYREKAAPRAEIAARDEGVRGENAEGADGQHGGLRYQSRLLLSIYIKKRRKENPLREGEQQDEGDVRRKHISRAHRQEKRRERGDHREDRMLSDRVQHPRLGESEHRADDRHEHAHENQRVRPANERRALGASANDCSGGERNTHYFNSVRCGVKSGWIIHLVPHFGAFRRVVTAVYPRPRLSISRGKSVIRSR